MDNRADGGTLLEMIRVRRAELEALEVRRREEEAAQLSAEVTDECRAGALVNAMWRARGDSELAASIARFTGMGVDEVWAFFDDRDWASVSTVDKQKRSPADDHSPDAAGVDDNSVPFWDRVPQPAVTPSPAVLRGPPRATLPPVPTVVHKSLTAAVFGAEQAAARSRRPGEADHEYADRVRAGQRNAKAAREYFERTRPRTREDHEGWMGA